MVPRLTATALVVLALVATATAAAGTSRHEHRAKADATVTTIDVGLIPIVDVAPLFLGLRKGFFAKRSLALKIQAAQTGPALVAAVQSGSADIGFAAVSVLLLGQSRGLEMKIVAPFSEVPGSGYQHILVKSDSPVRSIHDLQGKTVAIQGFGTVQDLAYHALAEKAGIPYSSLKLIPAPFPNMAQLISSGQVDAGSLPEPFLSQAMATGQFRIVRPPLLSYLGSRVPTGAWFASPGWLTENAAAARSFRDAMAESVAYARKHTKELRAVITKFMSVPADIVGKLTFPAYVSRFLSSSMQLQAEQLQRYGIAPKLPDANALVWNG